MVCNLMLTMLMAWPLSREDLPHRNKLGFFVYFTMLFNGDVVPVYIMWTQVFYTKNTYSALILLNLPTNTFYTMMTWTCFSPNVLDVVVEAVRIDDAEEFRILTQAVSPMSRPIMATLALLVGPKYWNDRVNGLYYIAKPEYYSVQVLLNRMLKDAQVVTEFSADPTAVSPSISYRMAVVVIGASSVPAIYPLFQRYPVKGIAIGTVEG